MTLVSEKRKHNTQNISMFIFFYTPTYIPTHMSCTHTFGKREGGREMYLT
jgi:hypothetical protein